MLAKRIPFIHLIYWARQDGNVTSYFDASFRPLDWHCVENQGRTYYAKTAKGKIRWFDSDLREIKPRKKEGFWSKLGRGLAVGLAVYAEAASDYYSRRSGYPGESGRNQIAPDCDFAYYESGATQAIIASEYETKEEL